MWEALFNFLLKLDLPKNKATYRLFVMIGVSFISVFEVVRSGRDMERTDLLRTMKSELDSTLTSNKYVDYVLREQTLHIDKHERDIESIKSEDQEKFTALDKELMSQWDFILTGKRK